MHGEQKEKSYVNLEHAREHAKKKSNYSSHEIWQALTAACLEKCNNQPPYPWQLDAAEAFYLGLDCTIIAGTGSGKSLPFIMPSMIHSNKILLVISPLNSLEADQARRCSQIGIAAVAVNHNTYTSELHEELVGQKYQIIFTSPEMAISNLRFNTLLCSREYHQHLCGIVIDEAHCIVQWGGQFRPAFAKVDKLRSFVPMNVPMYVTSATMEPSVLAEVRRLLHINPSQSFHLNLGNDRRNIYQEVRLIRNATDFSSLDFLFEGVTHFRSFVRPEVLTEVTGVYTLDGWVGVRVTVISSASRKELVEICTGGWVVCKTGRDMVARERAIEIICVVVVVVEHWC